MYLRLAISLWVIASWACSPSTGKAKAAPDWRRVPVSLELRLAEGAPAPGLVPATVYGQGATVYLHPEVQVSNSHIARVEAVKTRLGKGLILEVWLTKAGAERLAGVTGRHIGDSLAVLINSVVVSVPIIQETLGRDTKLPNSIGVPLGAEEAEQLAAAVSKTWPPASASFRTNVRKDGM
jgi:preprotein translocase subunit SecD